MKKCNLYLLTIMLVVVLSGSYADAQEIGRFSVQTKGISVGCLEGVTFLVKTLLSYYHGDSTNVALVNGLTFSANNGSDKWLGSFSVGSDQTQPVTLSVTWEYQTTSVTAKYSLTLPLRYDTTTYDTPGKVTYWYGTTINGTDVANYLSNTSYTTSGCSASAFQYTSSSYLSAGISIMYPSGSNTTTSATTTTPETGTTTTTAAAGSPCSDPAYPNVCSIAGTVVGCCAVGYPYCGDQDGKTVCMTSPPYAATTTTPYDPEPCPATQVLGANNPKLKKLRDFRDSTLINSGLGRALIQIYYNNAEAINAVLESNPILRAATQRLFDVITMMVGNKQ